MKRILILVEGDTEKKLVNTLQILGKVQIINLWEKPINKIIPRIKEDLVLIIYDTDTLVQIDLFKKNLETLSNNRINFSLVQQTHNLEDEIVKCSKCKRIHDVFNTQGVKEFKSQFLKCQNLPKKLDNINFNPKTLWVGQLIPPLLPWQANKKSFVELTLK